MFIGSGNAGNAHVNGSATTVTGAGTTGLGQDCVREHAPKSSSSIVVRLGIANLLCLGLDLLHGGFVALASCLGDAALQVDDGCGEFANLDDGCIALALVRVRNLGHRIRIRPRRAQPHSLCSVRGNRRSERYGEDDERGSHRRPFPNTSPLSITIRYTPNAMRSSLAGHGSELKSSRSASVTDHLGQR